MKRSEVDEIITDGLIFTESLGFHLPSFARWSPTDFAERVEAIGDIIDNMLGWDVTDFGEGDFPSVGSLIFTLRNGSITNSKYPKPYAEKILMQREGQVLPWHFHYTKREDIINRGGGVLAIELSNSSPSYDLLETPVDIVVDGESRTVPSKESIKLAPGESVSIPPGMYHRFWAEKGHGPVLAGEVSSVNDDTIDNHFLGDQTRIPEIEEDVPAKFMLFADYGRLSDST